MAKRKYKICVIGAWRDYSSKAEQSAKLVGKWLAVEGHTLITGACLGIPSITAKSYIDNGGKKSIGFSPANSRRDHTKKNGLSCEDIFHDLRFMDGKNPLDYPRRNILNIEEADAVVLISGRMGAIMEYTIAFGQNKPIGIVTGVGGASSMIRSLEFTLYKKEKSLFSNSPIQLMPRLINKIY